MSVMGGKLTLRNDAAMRSETGKLPKGHSYPLKPSTLEAALSGAGIGIDGHLIRSPGELFDAHFWPRNENVSHERLYVRAGSVPSERDAEARLHAENVIVPELVRWIANILAEDTKSPIRREQQVLDLGDYVVYKQRPPNPLAKVRRAAPSG